MTQTTLPNAKTLDKVYPSWRKLVSDGSVSKFIQADVVGAMQTSVFGLSSPFGSDVSATAGLQEIILESPYPNFATSMALSEEHFVQIGSDGCFGTIRRSDMKQTHEFDTSLRPYHLNAVSQLKALPVHRGAGWVHRGKWSLAGAKTAEPIADDVAFSTLNASYANNLFTAAPGTDAHSAVLGLLVPAIQKLGYKVDRTLPVILTHDNYNGQAAGNANHSGEMLTQYSRSTAVVNTGFALPGRKVLRVYTPETGATLGGVDTYNTNYTRCFNIYIDDNGSPWTPVFFNNLHKYQGADAWIYYGNDGRYIEPSKRTLSWEFSTPALLRHLFGDQISIDGVKYNLISTNDGYQTTGPMITDKVMGSQKGLYINFTPLLGIPGALNYSFVGKVELGTSATYLVDGVEVTLDTYSIDASFFLARLNYDWYELYYKTGFDVYTPKTSNIQANVLDSWADIKAYGITVCAVKNEYMLTEQMIQALPAYQEYGRVRKKACKDNNFLQLKFDDKYTYRQVLDKAKPRNAFMQLVSTESHSSFKLNYQQITSVQVTNGVATFTILDGTVAPLSTEIYYQYLLTGKPAVSAITSALGADPLAIAEIQRQAKDVRGINTDASYAIGDGTNDFVTDRAAQTVNGFPIYPALSPTQRTYLMLTNISQYDNMLLPLIRVIQSLSAEKMWIRFK